MSTARRSEAQDRCADLARRWRVSVGEIAETESSVLAFGQRDELPVVIKVVKQAGDEWHSGAVLHAFGGRGFVRVLEHVDGAMLLERLDPGESLVTLAVNGRDEEATSILADVIAAMSPDRAPAECPTLHDWARGFERYRASGDTQVPRELVLHAERLYRELCESQRAPRLLHGDLHHYNVLRDRERGWLAIDPKGVIGELEYELGAILRNPGELPSLVTDELVIRSRIDRLCSALVLDAERALTWGFAQAVLSAIWDIEDGHGLGGSTHVLVLATTMRDMFSPR